MSTTAQVSIILPCYNEEEHLRESVDELYRVARSFEFPYEFVFVEDYSTDRTRAILKELSATLPNASFVYHEHNKGRGAAVKSGYAIAKGSIIGFMDIDLEISPQYIVPAIRHLDKHDAVVARRSYFSQLSVNSLFRNTTSRAYKRISKIMLGHSFADTEAGFKFFHRHKVDPFFLQVLDNHWFWDTEFMLSLEKNRLQVYELPVEFIRNNRKKSTVSFMRDTRKYISAIFRYRKRK